MNDTSRQNPGYRSTNLFTIGNIMIERVYFIDDIVWIHMGGPKNLLSEGRIVYLFVHYGRPQYIIEINTSIDPILEVRDWSTISETPEGPINLFRGIFNGGMQR